MKKSLWTMDFNAEKGRLHELIERISPERSGAFLHALKSLSADPVLLSLLNAPPDDEPYTEEQRREDANAEDAIARAEGIKHEDLLREFVLDSALEIAPCASGSVEHR